MIAGQSNAAGTHPAPDECDGKVRFLLDGEVVVLDGVDPTETVLEMLRYRLRRTGTKEGCAEGDCGACTVVLGELDPGGSVSWKAVNACILFVPMLDGRALVTVETLSREGALHPVQQAMVDKHGSQCGFCTPGFVMALYARSISGAGMEEGVPVAEAISGNLCRCTGYGPIIASGEANPPVALADDETVSALRRVARSEALVIHGKDMVSGAARTWMAPRTLGELAQMRLDHPDARVLAGATDVGLWVTKQHRQMDAVIWLGEVAELRRCELDDDGLTLGAGVSYTAARATLAQLHPDLDELVRRIAGPQVRNSGTIGGNIANGSPIGDMPPALIALGAQITLRRGDERRTIPLEDFFIQYGKQDIQPGEFLETVHVPQPAGDSRIGITKLSKRFASDITAVLGAFAVQMDGETIVDARLAFGGMAGIPQRASASEAALNGSEWSEAAFSAAAAALTEDFSPLTDVRGTSDYRLTAARNLLERFRLRHDHPGEALSVLEVAGSDG